MRIWNVDSNEGSFLLCEMMLS